MCWCRPSGNHGEVEFRFSVDERSEHDPDRTALNGYRLPELDINIPPPPCKPPKQSGPQSLKDVIENLNAGATVIMPSHDAEPQTIEE